MSLFINIHTESCSDFLNIRHYFEEWRKASPKTAGTVRLEICQQSIFTLASKWQEYHNKLQSATDSEARAHYLSVAQRNQKATRTLLRNLNLSRVEYVIWPYFVHEYVSLAMYESK